MTTLRIALRKYADFENAMGAQIERYCAEHPEIAIEMVPMPLDRLHAELFAEQGLRQGRYDLGLLVTDWLADAVAAGTLENLSPYMASAPFPDWPAGWAPSIREPLAFGGDFYCIPWHDGPECLIYRSDLFGAREEQAAFRAKHGYELAPPQNWKQFEDIARFFTRPEKQLWGTLFACYPDGHNTLYDFALQVWTRGGELQDASGKPMLATRQAEAALDFYRRVVRDAELCHPRSIDLDSVESGDVFLSGQIAMMVNWFGFAARSGRRGGALEGRVALAEIPREEGLPAVSLSVFWTLAIASGSKNKQAAYDFVRFLTHPEQDRAIVPHGPVGVRLSTWRDAEIQRAVPAFAKIEAISAGARRLPRTPSLPEFAEIVNGIVESALRSDESSAAILQRAQQQCAERGIRFE